MLENGFCKFFLFIIWFFDGSYRLIYMDLFDLDFENILRILFLVNLINVIWVILDFYLDKYVVVYFNENMLV